MTRQLPRHIISFDAEATSLHGTAFAVGGVLMETASGDVVDSFALRAVSHPPVCDWVRDNVLSRLTDVPTCATVPKLRDQFWNWLALARRADAIIVVDCGWPVEANLLSACVADYPSRQDQAPYPIHEVATILLSAGLDPLGNYWTTQMSDAEQALRHNPLVDAKQSALCARTALMRLVSLGALSRTARPMVIR